MAAVTSLSETPAAESAGRPRGMQARRRRRLNLFRYVVFTVFGLFFLLPLLAMARFSLEGAKLGTWSLTAWKQIASYSGTGIPPLISSIEITLELAVITCAVMLVLLVPTMIWVRLRVQWLARTMEFLCLLPLTIPAIALVVGLGEIYNRLQHFSLSALMLFWVYVILALPYAYQALAAGLSAINVDDPVRGRAQPRGELVHRDGAGDRAEHAAGHPERPAADRIPGARRVHHRLSPAL